MVDKPKLNVDAFPGVVVTMDWIRMPGGQLFGSFKGTVSVMSANEAVGWEPTGHNSANWLVRIHGPKASVNLMGCQVRLILEGDHPYCDGADTYLVP